MVGGFRSIQDGREEGWHQVSQKTEFRSPHLQVDQMVYASPERKSVPWTVARRKAAVVFAPRTSDGKYLMIRQERVAVERTLWEFPAGQIDGPSKDLTQSEVEETADRELAEECGQALAPDGGIRHLGYFFASPGFTDECAYLMEMGPVVELASGARPEASECITGLRAFSLSEIQAMVANNLLVDANSLSLVARLLSQQNTETDS